MSYVIKVRAYGAADVNRVVDEIAAILEPVRSVPMANSPVPPIPGAFRAPCALCGADLDVRREGVHQWTSGWVKLRSGGGGNAIALPERAPRWAHGRCVESASRGTTNQVNMFG